MPLLALAWGSVSVLALAGLAAASPRAVAPALRTAVVLVPLVAALAVLLALGATHA